VLLLAPLPEPSIAHDIEPNNSVVNVTKAKGGRQRRVHLNAETIKMLSDYVSTLQLPDEQPVFALKQRQVRNIVKRYGSVIGKDIHPHTFRNSYAIHCVRNG
jgi:site-specific recombinase XerD